MRDFGGDVDDVGRVRVECNDDQTLVVVDYATVNLVALSTSTPPPTGSRMLSLMQAASSCRR